MSQDIFKRRLEGAMNDAADVAEAMADDRSVQVPPQQVAQMGLSLFRARVGVLTMERSDYDLPEDTRREMQ